MTTTHIFSKEEDILNLKASFLGVNLAKCNFVWRELQVLREGTYALGNFFASELLLRELFHQGAISREHFLGNSFEGTFSQGTFSKETNSQILHFDHKPQAFSC
jgi:hypothetical protein